MANQFPPLRLETVRTRSRYVFGAPLEAFPYSEWAPVLVDIGMSRTIGEQKAAFTRAIVSAAAYYHGLWTVRDSCATTSWPHARFRIRDEGISLSSVSASGYQIGYQTPDAATPSPATAVLDSWRYRDPEHEVFRSPTEELTPAAEYLGKAVVTQLASSLDSIYPGLELYAQLPSGMLLHD